MSSVHPSAIGSGAQPNRDDSHEETSIPRQDSSASQQSTPQAPPGVEPYPKQIHAGKVGYGPNYRTGPSFSDKLHGLEEEFKGKVTRNHELFQHGKDLRTGEIQRREREQDLNEDSPFKKPGDDASSGGSKPPNQQGHDTDKGAKEQAGVVAPEGTHAADKQRSGQDVKHIG